MINCDETYDFLPVYVGGGLDDIARRDIAAHLAVCAGCRGETVLLFKLKLAQKSLMPEMPDVVRLDAFNLIREEQAKTEENTILLDTLFGALNLTRSAVQLTCELIRI